MLAGLGLLHSNCATWRGACRRASIGLLSCVASEHHTRTDDGEMDECDCPPLRQSSAPPSRDRTGSSWQWASEVCRPLSCPAAACLHQGAHVYCLLCTIVCTYIHVLLTPTRPSTRPVCANRCVRALCGRSLSVSLCALAAPQHPSALSPLSPSPLSLYVYSKGPTPPTNAYRPRHACILLSTATDAHTLSLCCQMDKGCARFPPSPTLGKGVPPPILRVCVCKCVSSLCSSGTCAVRAYSVQYSTVHYIICAVALNLLNLLTTSP